MENTNQKRYTVEIMRESVTTILDTFVCHPILSLEGIESETFDKVIEQPKVYEAITSINAKFFTVLVSNETTSAIYTIDKFDPQFGDAIIQEVIAPMAIIKNIRVAKAA
jgi:hypothetical protein